ncbi:MAG: LamG domain-containing protein [Nanoarchaeota archaeon]|nr:LamG domain-containing protein [Nanoarchaeota archaeon]
MNKKGLSDVITNVLIILLVIVAVGVIAAFLIPLLKGTTDKSANLNTCLTQEVLVKKCEVAMNGINDYNVSVIVSRGVGKGEIGEASIVLNKADGSSSLTKLTSPGSLVEYASVSHFNRTNFKPSFASVAIKLKDVSNACEASEKVACKMVSSVAGGAVTGGGGNPPAVDVLTGLISWWKFNEASYIGSTNEVRDSQGLNHGTPSVNTALVSAGGSNGNALSLDGAKYITITSNPTSAFSTINSYTLSAWIKTTNNNAQTRIYSQQANGGSPYYILGLKGNKIWCPSSVSSAETLNTNYGDPLNDGNWHFVACVRSSNSRFYWYVDDKLVGDVPIASQYPANTFSAGSGIYIGAYNAASEKYNGLVDDVRVYNVPLTHQDIRDIRSATMHT